MESTVLRLPNKPPLLSFMVEKLGQRYITKEGNIIRLTPRK